MSDNYVWLLADASGAAIVVDPGEAAPVRAALAREKLDLAAVLLTHHHPDHIGGAAALIRRRADSGLRAERRAHRVRGPSRRATAIASTIESPTLRFDVIGIPGPHAHATSRTHGHGIVFCGDTLFSVGCGRIFEGTPEQMLASLDRLAALPGDTLVCCGHEYTVANCAFAATVDPDNAALARRIAQARAQRERGAPTLPVSLAEERACNPFLRVDTDAIVPLCPMRRIASAVSPNCVGARTDSGRRLRDAARVEARDRARARGGAAGRVLDRSRRARLDTARRTMTRRRPPPNLSSQRRLRQRPTRNGRSDIAVATAARRVLR